MHVISLLFQLFYTMETNITECDNSSYGTKKNTPYNLAHKSIYSGDEYCFMLLFHQVVSFADN